MEPEKEEVPEEKVKDKKEGPPICMLYITRKRRQCKFPAVQGSKYCAAHCSDLQEKVQCPHEKGFFISVKKLQKHLKNCPKLVNVKKQQNSSWFSKDINKAEQEMVQHAIEMPNLAQVPEEIMQKIVQKIIQMYLKHVDQKDHMQFICSDQKEKLQETTNDHLQAKLITEKAFQNKLIAPEFVYVEFGAGKGVLSFAIATKIKEEFQIHSKNILLQRQSRRNKFDRFFKNNPYFQRFKGDVANFDFTCLPHTMAQMAVEKCKLDKDPYQIQQQIGQLQLVGVCKHMCGQALDISMRGLLQGNAKGCILASCCHHRCRYHTYLNPKFFEREGLSPEEIQILFRVSSWGTMSHYFPALPNNIFKTLKQTGYMNLSPSQKILVGRMTKRVIDLGRAEYLKGKLFKYCSDQLTPQNYVIISKN